MLFPTFLLSNQPSIHSSQNNLLAKVMKIKGEGMPVHNFPSQVKMVCRVLVFDCWVSFHYLCLRFISSVCISRVVNSVFLLCPSVGTCSLSLKSNSREVSPNRYDWYDRFGRVYCNNVVSRRGQISRAHSRRDITRRCWKRILASLCDSRSK
jgi:hypothetical protein